MIRLLPIVVLLSACTSAPVPWAISDAMEADSGLPLSSVVVEGWQVLESCRPHLCHAHRMLTITAPDGESLIVLVARARPTASLRPSGCDPRDVQG